MNEMFGEINVFEFFAELFKVYVDDIHKHTEELNQVAFRMSTAIEVLNNMAEETKGKSKEDKA